MKYIIMENRPNYSVVMDEDGLFHRVANLGYEIGETITDPIFMKAPERKKKMDLKKMATIAAIFVCFILASVPFLNNNAENDVTVYMSINPAIHLEFNENGKIKELVADNGDGIVLLEGYEYRGKSVSSVLIELIDRADKLDYLSEGGNVRITVEANDKFRARNVQANLSADLMNAYVKKYQIKIKANKEVFRDIDDVVYDIDADSNGEIVKTTGNEDGNYEGGYSESTAEASGKDTSNKSEREKETTKSTQSSKPATKPTQGTTVERPPDKPADDVTKPTESTTEATKPTEDSSGKEDDEDDSVWPW